MQDDFTVFRCNNERARALFYDLLERAERGAYDDDFLAQLAAYREEAADAVHADIFAARYLLAQGDAEGAAVCGMRAHEKCPQSAAAWSVLAAAYRQLGNAAEAAVFEAYAHRFAQAPLPAWPTELNDAVLARLTRAMNGCLDAPLAKKRAVIENHALTLRPDVFVGEYLPVTVPAGSERFWVAAYADRGFLSDRGYMIADARTKDWFQDNVCRDFPFDLQKARAVSGTVQIAVPEGRTAVLPVGGTAPLQELIAQTPSHDDQLAYLGKWSYSHLRLAETTTLTCEDGTPFARMEEAGRLHLPTDDECGDMYDYITAELPRLGYRRYEISNYAKAGEESRHNLAYWQDVPYIGLGAAAHSYWHGRRTENEKDFCRYIACIEGGLSPAREEEPCSRESHIEEFTFLALRTADGIDKQRFRNTFASEVQDIYGKVIARLQAAGLVEETAASIRLTAQGMKFGNRVFAEFLLEGDEA